MVGCLLKVFALIMQMAAYASYIGITLTLIVLSLYFAFMKLCNTNVFVVLSGSVFPFILVRDQLSSDVTIIDCSNSAHVTSVLF